MPPPLIALISDDLTGALDAAAPFVAAGLRTRVATTPEGVALALEAMPDVLAVSTNTREGNAADAARIAAKAAESLACATWLFKKIDSRLKGHVGDETLAIAHQRGSRRIVLCPAIPEMGRIVRGGHVQGFGVTNAVNVAAVSAGLPDYAVFQDAETDAELDALLAGEDADTLFVGARGLASAMARRLSVGSGVDIPRSLAEPAALCVGSRDPITVNQIERLRLARPDIAWIAAPNGQANISAAAQSGSLILQVTSGDTTQSGADVTTHLARSFAKVCVEGRASLFLTGGETAAAVLRELNVTVLDLLGEIFPGLPMARPVGVPNAPIIITKSGGFGDGDVLCQLFPARTRLQA